MGGRGSGKKAHGREAQRPHLQRDLASRDLDLPKVTLQQVGSEPVRRQGETPRQQIRKAKQTTRRRFTT